MGKFTFPIDQAKLAALFFKSPEILEALRPFGTDNNVSYAISAMKAGYVNKMHHKTRQEEDRALLEMVKNDPQLKKKLEDKVLGAVKKNGTNG